MKNSAIKWPIFAIFTNKIQRMVNMMVFVFFVHYVHCFTMIAHFRCFLYFSVYQRRYLTPLIDAWNWILYSSQFLLFHRFLASAMNNFRKEHQSDESGHIIILYLCHFAFKSCVQKFKTRDKKSKFFPIF